MSDIKKRDKSDSLTKPSGAPDFSKMRKRTGAIQPVSDAIKTVTKSPTGLFPGLQIVMMFDLTGSMYDYFDLVREKLSNIASSIKKQIQNAEFSIIGYRNHGDEGRYEQIFYTYPLTGNMEEIQKKVSSIRRGGGGPDALCCMEDCLRECNSLSWNSQSPKAIVVIGDVPPHGVVDSFSVCPKEIDYRNEVAKLKSKGVKIYPVYCNTHYASLSGRYQQYENFYRWLAEETGSEFLMIKDIDLLEELLIAISMKMTGNLDKYLDDLSKTGQLNPKRKKAIAMLTGGQ